MASVWSVMLWRIHHTVVHGAALPEHTGSKVFQTETAVGHATLQEMSWPKSLEDLSSKMGLCWPGVPTTCYRWDQVVMSICGAKHLPFCKSNHELGCNLKKSKEDRTESTQQQFPGTATLIWGFCVHFGLSNNLRLDEADSPSWVCLHCAHDLTTK